MGMNLNTWIAGIVAVVVFIALISSLMPVAQTESTKFNDSNLCNAVGCFYNHSNSVCSALAVNTSIVCAHTIDIPLRTMFSSSGVVFILVMAGLLLALVAYLLGKSRK